jgi:hypothetical protein
MTASIHIPEWYRSRPYARERYAEIAQWALAHHPFYRKHVPDPTGAFPVLTRAMVQADNDLLLNGYPETSRTSGSTSTPVRTSWDAARAQLEKADTNMMVKWLGGVLPALRIVSTWVHAPDERTIDVVTPPAQQVEFIRQRHGVDGACSIATYPSNLELLSHYIIDHQLDLSFVRRVSCLSEVYEEKHDELIRAAFPNAFAHATYSSAEAGLIAARCPHRPDNYHIMAHKLGVEFLDDAGHPCQHGELGRVVLTDFENRRSALIRYAQGDLAAPIRCDCGKIPLPAMTQIVGKVQGVFRTREGRQIIFTHFSPMFRDSPEIGQYQVLQEAFDRFTVRCVPRANADLETFKQRVRQRFEQEFGPDLRIDYEILAEIPRAASGKFHVSICRIAD